MFRLLRTFWDEVAEDWKTRFSDRDPLTGVPPSRHPFQVFILGACVFGGMQAGLGKGAPPTMSEFLPHIFIVAWAWMLVTGGLLGIIAAWMPDRITGLLLERIALAAIATATLAYGTVVLKAAGNPAVVTSSFQFAACAASIWRIFHINRELKRLALKTRKLHEILNDGG